MLLHKHFPHGLSFKHQMNNLLSQMYASIWEADSGEQHVNISGAGMCLDIVICYQEFQSFAIERDADVKEARVSD